MKKPKLISIPDAAELIGCSRGHCYNLIAAGRLKRYNIALKGSKIRLSEEDVYRYIAEAEEPVSGDAA